MKNRSVKVILPLLLAAGCSSLGHQLRHLTGGAEARLADDVVIERDEWGVPHVEGRSDAAVAFGAAWAMAEDNFRELEEGYIRALGRSAYYYGEQQLAEDLVAAALRVEALARAEYAHAPESMQRLLQGYAHGLNYYLRRHPAEPPRVISRYEPWMVLARLRAVSAERRIDGVRLGDVAALAGAPGAGSRAPLRDGGGGAALAVAPARAAGGHALLLASAAAPFFGSEVPYELEMRSETGWQVHGLALLGVPVPFMGRNERLAWGSAAARADSSSVRRVLFDNPADSLAYRVGEGWGRAVAWLDTIQVNTSAGVQARTFRFLRTEWGPVIGKRGDTALIAQLPGLEAGGRLQRWLGTARARSLAEFRAALAEHPVAGLATVYADVAGNILSDPGDGTSPSVNPAVGVVGAGDGAAALAGAAPVSLDLLADLALGITGAVPGDEIALLVNEWEQVGGRNSARAFAMDSAVEMLRGWGGDAGLGTRSVRPPGPPENAGGGATDSVRGNASGPDSAQATAATLYRYWREAQLAQDEASGTEGTAARRAAPGAAFPRFRALEEAVAQLRREWGTMKVPWSELARLQRPGASEPPSFSDDRPSIGLEGIASGGVFGLELERGPGRRRYAVSGTAAVMVTELSTPPRTRSVVVFGQAADSASPHFFDQAARYARGELKELQLNAAGVGGEGTAAAGAGRSGAPAAGGVSRERYHPGQRARVLRGETPAGQHP